MMIFNTLMGTATTLDKLFKIFKDNEDELQVGKLLDKKSRKVIAANGNVFRLMDDLLVEPKILVSKSLKNHEAIYDVINFNATLFTSIYRNVFYQLTGIHGLDAVTTLSLLSSGTPGEGGLETSRTLLKDVETKWGTMTMEVGLEAHWRPRPVKKREKNKSTAKDNGNNGYSSHAATGSTSKNEKDDKNTQAENTINVTDDYTPGKNEKDEIVERLLRTIKFKIVTGDGKFERTIIVPVSIRPAIVYVPNSDFLKLIKANGDETSLSAAWHAWQSGEKTKVDVAFGTSLVKDYKKERLTDVDSSLLDVENRKRLAYAKVVKDGATGFGLLYQMCIIPSALKGDLNVLLRGSIDKDRIKDKFLEISKSMTLTVIDADFPMVSIYLNTLKGSQDIPLKNLKDKSGKNDELSDLFKLMTTSGGI